MCTCAVAYESITLTGVPHLFGNEDVVCVQCVILNHLFSIAAPRGAHSIFVALPFAACWSFRTISTSAVSRVFNREMSRSLYRRCLKDRAKRVTQKEKRKKEKGKGKKENKKR